MNKEMEKNDKSETQKQRVRTWMTIKKDEQKWAVKEMNKTIKKNKRNSTRKWTVIK